MNPALRIIIADDEPLARQLMSSLLKRIDNVELIAACRNGSELIDAVHRFQPDLLIIDIEMPSTNGFEAVRRLQGDDLPLIIFATAYSNYAVEAFAVNAIDYLLKPIALDRLAVAVNRAREQFARRSSDFSLSSNSASNEKERLINAMLALDDDLKIGQWHQAKRIAVRQGSAINLIEYEQIIWIEAAGDYMCLHDSDRKTHILRSTMNELLERLKDSRFLRVHRSTAVNIDLIIGAQALPKGEYLLTMQGDDKVKVSRNYRQPIRSYLDAIQG